MQENISYKQRIESIDLLRGLVILLMALDHVRDFFGVFYYPPEDIAHVTSSLFMTRWITNLCAPTFVFLTGISAYLFSLKATKKELSEFLIKRGLFLIFCEVSIISWAWTFQMWPTVILQVIWALGLSMIVLAGLIWLPKKMILLFSLIVIFGHNLFDVKSFTPTSLTEIMWSILHVRSNFQFHDLPIVIVYPLLPWAAIMSLGYCLGHWMEEPVPIRNEKFFLFGMASLILFLVLRLADVYGDSYHWKNESMNSIQTLLSFIKVTKYPPSLFYVLINLGIITLLWPIWEYWRGFGRQFVLVFGKVAMFFYLLHIPIIHFAANIYWYLKLDFHVSHIALPSSSKSLLLNEKYFFSLSFVYIVWIIVIVAMYPLCLAYKNFKSKNRYWWLKYI